MARKHKNYTNKIFMTRIQWWCDHSPRARNPGMQRQVAFGRNTMNKASGGNGIPAELFQIQKKWCCESAALNMPANLENSALATGPEKVSFHSDPQKGSAKVCSNCCTIELISYAYKVMLKILKARLQQELPDVQAGFWFTRNQTTSIIIEKAKEFQKNIYFCFIDYVKAFDCVDHNNLWKILTEMGIPDHFVCLLRNLYAGQETTVRTRHGTTDWFKIRKGVTSRLYFVTLLI